MSHSAISVQHLGKSYRISHQGSRERYVSLRDVIAQRLKKTFRPRSIQSEQYPTTEDFWALKDISFEIKQGEVIGIIGRNGAGKSTLLKILSRITEPTEGRIRIKGRVASLLEVGTGFHPELTGRENIYLNGAILGMTRAEIRKKFDEIIAFAEVEKFLDTPVKRYSSGMYVRLAFAVAAHLEPEILIVDEVLAVGDAQFQKKCLGKISDVSQKDGRTVLFVSHNMAAVQALCGRAIYLLDGQVKDIGQVDELVSQYQSDANPGNNRQSAGPVKLGNELELLAIKLDTNPLKSGDPLRLTMEFRAIEQVRVSELALLFFSPQGSRIAILDLRPFGLPSILSAGQFCSITSEIISLPLVEGEYQIGFYMGTGDFNDNVLDLVRLTIIPRGHGQTGLYPAVHRGMLELDFTAKIQTP